jgi:hypothetical protein
MKMIGTLAGVEGYLVELQTSGYDSPTDHQLIDIQTGQLGPATVSPGGRVTFDLNSQGGARALCAPITYPRHWKMAGSAVRVAALTTRTPYVETDNARLLAAAIPSRKVGGAR